MARGTGKPPSLRLPLCRVSTGAFPCTSGGLSGALLEKKRLSQARSLVSSVPAFFPNLTVTTKPSSKAGFGGVLALLVRSMRLHSGLPRGVTGSTSWACTKCERWADIYVSAPTGRTLRLFMGKMNFGHEDHYSKCKLRNIFLERLSFFLFWSVLCLVSLLMFLFITW